MTLELDQHITTEASPARITPPLLEGTFAKDVAALTDMAYVSVNAYDDHYRYGPCPWMPRGVTLPHRGDRCLVAFTENEDKPWIVAWWV